MKTICVHIKKYQGEQEVVYVGRKKNTEQHYGNPFKIGAWGFTRNESLKRYELWITENDYQDVEPERRKWILDNLDVLKGKALACWCKPKDCHGDILVSLVEDVPRRYFGV
jgi:hypothetical protein